MKEFSLYRKRIIPNECILLKDDERISFDGDRFVTKWSALHPKPDLHHGISCYCFDLGCKVSKFYTAENKLLYWYIDIISHEWSAGETSLVVTDLLADILIYPDGFVKVVDVDEIADAFENGRISTQQLATSLRTLDRVLSMIYSGEFDKIKAYVERFE